MSNHMTEKDAAAFRAAGYNVKAHPSTKEKKPVTEWKLVYMSGKTVIDTLIEGNYGLCAGKKKALKDDPLFTIGKLKIIPA